MTGEPTASPAQPVAPAEGADRPPRLFISAGELSGDLIGSLLIKRLRRFEPEIQVTGLGGDRMATAGANVLKDMVHDLAIIGFVEVVRKYPKIKRVFNQAVDWLRTNRPDAVVLIDYPGFNLRLAEAAHKLGIPVIYYVCPQLWAWHESRIVKFRKFVDKALVILPFEENWYRERDVAAQFVGTPWLDSIILTMSREEVIEHFGLDPNKRVIGLLPGSRKREAVSLLPVMLEAAEKIQARMPDVQFVLPRASTIRPELIDHLLTLSPVEVKVIDTFRYNARAAMDLAIVASGTATLETGLLGSPMIIIYKVAWLSWLIGKNLVKIPYVGLINLVAGDMVVPELIQDQCTGENVAERAERILSDPREIERVKYQLSRVQEKMGGRGASERAARVVLEMIGRPPGEAVPLPETTQPLAGDDSLRM